MTIIYRKLQTAREQQRRNILAQKAGMIRPHQKHIMLEPPIRIQPKPFIIDESLVKEPFIIACGGIGDLVIAIAASYHDNKIKILFCSDTPDIVFKFTEQFGVKCELIPIQGYNYYSYHANCKSCCHIPPRRNYLEWWPKWENYLHISKYASFKGLFEPFPSNLPIITIQPASKDRILKRCDYDELMNKFLNAHVVYAIGSDINFKNYNINNPNFHWLTFENEYHAGKVKENSVRRTLSIINSSKIVFGVDSWLKTYAYYAEVPLIVFSKKHDIFTDIRVWDRMVLKDIQEYTKEI